MDQGAARLDPDRGKTSANNGCTEQQQEGGAGEVEAPLREGTQADHRPLEKDGDIEPDAVAADVVDVERRLLGGIRGLPPGAGQARLDGGEWHAGERPRLGLGERAGTDQAQLATQHVQQPGQLRQQVGVKRGRGVEAEEVEGGTPGAQHPAAVEERRLGVPPLPGHHDQQHRRQSEQQNGRQPPIEDGFDGALDRG